MTFRLEPHSVIVRIGREFQHEKKEFQVHTQLLHKLHVRITKSFSEDSKEEEYPLANHNYLIAGKRGSGKSTFLENLLKLLLNDDETQRISHGVRFAKLLTYDPSASTGGANYFILNVFAALQSELDKLSSCNCSPDSYSRLKNCRNLVRKLCSGLSRLSHGKAPLSCMTPDLVSELNLDYPDRDEYIRSLFSELITIMCDMMKVQAFIITIDDSDTSSHQCFCVMEALRLYLSHPNIIVLMTGDKNILLERIREHHFKEFDTNYHQMEKQRQDMRMTSVVAHTGQYLLKLFPIYNQHELQNLLTLSRKASPVILHVQHGDLNPVLLREVVIRAFGRTISPNLNEIKPFVDQFFTLPLRAILQILKYWTDDNLWDVLLPTPASSANVQESEAEIKKRVSYSVRMALKRVVQSEMGTSRYNFESLLADDGRTFFSLMIKHCQDMGDLEHGFYLSGDMGSTKEDKHITMLLAVTFGKIIQKLDGFISYLLYGPATVSLYAKAVEQYRRAPRKQNINTPDKLQLYFYNYLHVGSWQSSTRWARHANMIWCYDAGFEGLHCGILRLRHPRVIRRLRIMATASIRKIQKQRGLAEASGSKSYDMVCQLMAFAVSMSRSNERDNSYFISVYSYLAFILKCLNLYQDYLPQQEGSKTSPLQHSGSSEEDTIEAILTSLKKSVPFKSCRNPEWLIDKQSKGEADKSYNHESVNPFKKYKIIKLESINAELKELAKAIYQWCKNCFSKHCEKEDNLTPSLMGDIWSNLYYGLKQRGYHIDIEELRHVYLNKSVNERLSNYVGHLKAFTRVIHFFCQQFDKPLEREVRTLSDYYRSLIGSFPLTDSLKTGYEIFIDSINSDLSKKTAAVTAKHPARKR